MKVSNSPTNSALDDTSNCKRFHVFYVLQGSAMAYVAGKHFNAIKRCGCLWKKEGCALAWFRHALFSDAALLLKRTVSEKFVSKTQI